MKILHLEDNPRDAELTLAQLETELPGSEIHLVSSRDAFISELRRGGYDVILSDFGLIEFDGFEALELARQHAPGIPFVFLSGTIGEERAIAIMRAGAQDYVLKDRPWGLPAAIQRAVRGAEERRQRREAQEGQRRLMAMLEATPDLVCIAAPDEQLLYLNHAGRALIAKPTTESLEGLKLGDFFPPDDRAHLREEVWPILSQSSTWTGELSLAGRDGRTIPVSGVLLAHRTGDGDLAYVSAMLRDLSQQREADRRIREQAHLLDRASEVIFVTGADEEVTYWNHGAEKTLGWSVAEAVGRRIGDLFRLVEGSAENQFRTQLERAGEWHGEIVVLDKDGQRRVLESGFTLIRDKTGGRQACLGICSDITEKKSLEEKFLRAQRLESIGMLATGIAHDLNNVLAPVLLGVTMLRERDLDEDIMKVLASLERSAERGAALVRQILGFAHGIGGDQRVFDVRHLMRDVAAVARETFPRNIRVEQEVARHLWPISANPTQIHQVLLNLVVNARDAMPDGGTLRLSAENRLVDAAAAAAIPNGKPGSYLCMHVSDTGTGIPPDVLARLWEPFFTTKQPGKGTGLGLSTVRGIVENHHGFITIDTHLGRGTTFGIYLPAAEEAAEEGDEAAVTAAPRGANELILLVDDEAQVRELVTSILTHHGYRVITARDGVEAVALFAPRSNEIRLIVTDIEMPNLDGSALAAVIRRLNPDARVIAATGITGGDGQAPSGSHPLATLADAFLAKPFKAEVLLHTVHRLLHPTEHTVL